MAKKPEKQTITAADVGVLDLSQPTPEQVIRSISRTCRGPLAEGAREQINALLADGKPDEARGLDNSARTPCGYDFNEVILAHPHDGQTRATPCPQCGVVIRWTAPIFD